MVELGGRVSPPQCSAREGAGILAVFDDDLAIHNDVVNAYRVVMRVFSRGVSFDGGGVEDNDVRFEAVSQDTSVRQSEALGRERCHLANRFGEAQVLLGADELSQNYREAAVSTRVGVFAE